MSSVLPSDSASAPMTPEIKTVETGTLFIIAGPAGAGKNRLMKAVLELGLARQLPTATTRPMRPGEAQGREHLFVSKSEFERMLKDGELLEWQKIHDSYYGMHRPSLEAALNAGENLIADIDMYGARAVSKALPDNVVSIFIQTPTIADLIDRMRIRGETTASIALRLLRVGAELEFARESHAVITSDHVDHASDKLVTIIKAVLDGGRDQATCDSIITYRYTLHAQAVPVFGGTALARHRAPEYPLAVCVQDEQPARAARRAIQEALPTIPLPPETDPEEFRAPMTMAHRHDEDGVEIVTYTYLVPLMEQIDAPEGWNWTLITP
ncbi:MAG: hypothetical protein IPK19_34580 [Chloroflexi bacterium]|nr:hypothetical protein [Chloroflexota bacterium]